MQTQALNWNLVVQRKQYLQHFFFICILSGVSHSEFQKVVNRLVYTSIFSLILIDLCYLYYITDIIFLQVKKHMDYWFFKN